jgi:hypothetical protein
MRPNETMSDSSRTADLNGQAELDALAWRHALGDGTASEQAEFEALLERQLLAGDLSAADALIQSVRLNQALVSAFEGPDDPASVAPAPHPRRSAASLVSAWAAVAAVLLVGVAVGLYRPGRPPASSLGSAGGETLQVAAAWSEIRRDWADELASPRSGPGPLASTESWDAIEADLAATDSPEDLTCCPTWLVAAIEAVEGIEPAAAPAGPVMQD